MEGELGSILSEQREEQNWEPWTWRAPGMIAMEMHVQAGEGKR